MRVSINVRLEGWLEFTSPIDHPAIAAGFYLARFQEGVAKNWAKIEA
jgi:hypothetical protein